MHTRSSQYCGVLQTVWHNLSYKWISRDSIYAGKIRCMNYTSTLTAGHMWKLYLGFSAPRVLQNNFEMFQRKKAHEFWSSMNFSAETEESTASLRESTWRFAPFKQSKMALFESGKVEECAVALLPRTFKRRLALHQIPQGSLKRGWKENELGGMETSLSL